MSIERILLSSGEWWEIKGELTRGERRKIDDHTRRTGLLSVKEMQDSGLDLAAVRKMATGASVDGLVPPDMEDAMLVHGTISWSFPEPVSFESVANRTERDVASVLRRMKVLYVPSEEQTKN